MDAKDTGGPTVDLKAWSAEVRKRLTDEMTEADQPDRDLMAEAACLLLAMEAEKAQLVGVLRECAEGYNGARGVRAIDRARSILEKIGAA